LAGDYKYLKTTIFGLSGYAPDYCAILINSKIGWTAMTDEHLTIASAFKIPIFFVISKIDLVKQERVEKIICQIKSAVERNHENLQMKHVLTEEECVNAANSIGKSTLPVFTISNVSGENLELLTRFLNLLPNRSALSAGSDTDARPLFYVDEIYNFPEVRIFDLYLMHTI
jgi:GTPase